MSTNVSGTLGGAGARCQYLAVLLALLFAIVSFVLLYVRFSTYETGDDFGLFMQSVSDQSGWLRNSVEGSHYTNHFSPIYELIVPFTLWARSVVPLIAIQSAAGALAVLGVFQLARTMLPVRMALGLSCLSAIYVPLANLVYEDPYENVFAPAATIWLIWAVYQRRWPVAAALVLISLSIKEDQAIFLAWAACIAFFAAVKLRDRGLQTFCIFVFIMCAATLGSYLLVIRPAVVGNNSTWAALRLAFQPANSSLLNDVVGRATYLLAMLLPLMFLPLLAPRLFLLLLVVPVTEVLISSGPAARGIGSHYVGAWLGYVLVAAILGLARLHKRSPSFAERALWGAIGVCIVNQLVASPIPTRFSAYVKTTHDREVDRILATRLPARDVTIGAPDVVYAHLWMRRNAELGIRQSPRYVVIDMTLSQLPYTHDMLRKMSSGRLGEYRSVWNDHGVVLFQRASSGIN